MNVTSEVISNIVMSSNFVNTLYIRYLLFAYVCMGRWEGYENVEISLLLHAKMVWQYMILQFIKDIHSKPCSNCFQFC